jgi:hypothetical protein
MGEIRGKRPKVDYWLTKEGLMLIEGWAKDGVRELDIAHNMGISESTFNRWKVKYEAIGNALKTSKAVADRIVENALFRRATGFEYTETVEERVFNKVTNKFEMVVTKKMNKVVLPDTTAQIFWLKNKKPAEWRDRREIESTEAIDKLDSILTGIKEAAKKQEG